MNTKYEKELNRRGKMCIRVKRQVKIPHPEKKIRLKKKLETIK